MKTKLFLTLAALGVATVSANAAADVQVTEIMYTGLFGEFVEITNVGDANQDLTGWTFSDNRRGTTAGTNATSLSQIATLEAGDSAIITEVSDAIFIQAWYTEPTSPGPALAASDIVENNTYNLGRSDEVNINDNTGANKDRVTYNDQGASPVNGPRSEDISAKPGTNGTAGTFNNWVLSGSAAGGTPNGSAWKAGVTGTGITGPIGSPGTYPN